MVSGSVFFFMSRDTVLMTNDDKSTYIGSTRTARSTSSSRGAGRPHNKLYSFPIYDGVVTAELITNQRRNFYYIWQTVYDRRSVIVGTEHMQVTSPETEEPKEYIYMYRDMLYI